jgi:hypothetical protein
VASDIDLVARGTRTPVGAQPPQLLLPHRSGVTAAMGMAIHRAALCDGYPMSRLRREAEGQRLCSWPGWSWSLICCIGSGHGLGLGVEGNGTVTEDVPCGSGRSVQAVGGGARWHAVRGRPVDGTSEPGFRLCRGGSPSRGTTSVLLPRADGHIIFALEANMCCVF